MSQKNQKTISKQSSPKINKFMLVVSLAQISLFIFLLLAIFDISRMHYQKISGSEYLALAYFAILVPPLLIVSIINLVMQIKIRKKDKNDISHKKINNLSLIIALLFSTFALLTIAANFIQVIFGS